MLAGLEPLRAAPHHRNRQRIPTLGNPGSNAEYPQARLPGDVPADLGEFLDDGPTHLGARPDGSLAGLASLVGLVPFQQVHASGSAPDRIVAESAVIGRVEATTHHCQRAPVLGDVVYLDGRRGFVALDERPPLVTRASRRGLVRFQVLTFSPLPNR